jgi:hypothetical protein
MKGLYGQKGVKKSGLGQGIQGTSLQSNPSGVGGNNDYFNNTSALH